MASPRAVEDVVVGADVTEVMEAPAPVSVRERDVVDDDRVSDWVCCSSKEVVVVGVALVRSSRADVDVVDVMRSSVVDAVRPSSRVEEDAESSVVVVSTLL